jgi:hypothetical protein
MAEQKLHLFIRTSLVAPLIGKSQYNKDYEAFIKLLNMNKYFIYNDNNEFDNILSLVSDYENEIIKKKYTNINDLQKSLIEIQNFIYPDSILEKYKKYMICSFGKLNELLVLDKYLKINNINKYEQDNKKRRFAESNSSSITGSRQMKALSHKQKSRLFLSDRSKHYEFSQYNRILLVIPSVQSDNKEYGTVHILNPSIEAADRESLRVYDHIVKDYPGLIFETGRTETSVSFQLHELVPFAVELCKEMLVTDNSSKEKTGVRSAVLRDGSLDKVFANCIRIVTNEYVNNTALLNTVESICLQKLFVIMLQEL